MTRNCTVPLGVPDKPVIVAVSVTVEPAVTVEGDAMSFVVEIALPLVPLLNGVTLAQAFARLIRFTLPQPVARSYPLPEVNPMEPPP